MHCRIYNMYNKDPGRTCGCRVNWGMGSNTPANEELGCTWGFRRQGGDVYCNGFKVSKDPTDYWCCNCADVSQQRYGWVEGSYERDACNFCRSRRAQERERAELRGERAMDRQEQNARRQLRNEHENENNVKPQFGGNADKNQKDVSKALAEQQRRKEIEIKVNAQRKVKMACKNGQSEKQDLDAMTELVEQELAEAAQNDKVVAIPLLCVQRWTNGWSEDRILGEGAFGKVYKGVVASLLTVRPFSGIVAVKMLNRDVLIEQGDKHIKREINVLSRFRHPNIIKLIGYSVDDAEVAKDHGSPKHVCLVYEMGARGSLAQNLKEDNLAKELTWKARIQIGAGLVKAINYLHSHDTKPVFHRDVKSENVVLTSGLSPKLIDCGLAKLVGMDRNSLTVASTCNIPVGTPGYMCPRYSRGGIEFDAKCEVFAVGIVLLELLTGQIQNQGVNLYDKYFEEEEQMTADSRAGSWNVECYEKMKDIGFRCVEKYSKRVSSMLCILHELRNIESLYCRCEDEEARLHSILKKTEAMQIDDIVLKVLQTQLLEQKSLIQVLKESATPGVTAKQVCTVCWDEFRSTEGLLCLNNLHFLCSDCLNHEVIEQCSPNNAANFDNSALFVRCRQCQDFTIFDLKEGAQHLSAETFEAYLKAREGVLVREALFEQDLMHQETLRALQDSETSKVSKLRQRVVEDILTLKCPRCSMAFVDFDGCCALTCSSCRCGFCALCLQDCGEDAHQHVASCRLNHTGDLFTSLENFQSIQNARRVANLRAFMSAGASSSEQEALLQAIANDLSDLGIDLRVARRELLGK
eukprot:747184-Hanusia_phi.AAC.2